MTHQFSTSAEFFGSTGFALRKTHLIIDRDTKYAEGFRELLESAGVKIVLCPPRVPQCNAYAAGSAPDNAH